MRDFSLGQLTVPYSAITVNPKQKQTDLTQVSQTHLIELDVLGLKPKFLEMLQGPLLVLNLELFVPVMVVVNHEPRWD